MKKDLVKYIFSLFAVCIGLLSNDIAAQQTKASGNSDNLNLAPTRKYKKAFLYFLVGAKFRLSELPEAFVCCAAISLDSKPIQTAKSEKIYFTKSFFIINYRLVYT